MPNLLIRSALPSDAPTLLEITQAAFSEYASLSGQAHTASFAPLAETEESILAAIRSKKVWIGFYNKTKAIGTIRCEILPGKVAYISRFAVLPNWQQVGMGKELLAVAEQYARQEKAEAICLHTATKMIAQVRFYTNHSYFVHSTSQDRGYIRGLFVKELTGNAAYNLTAALEK